MIKKIDGTAVYVNSWMTVREDRVIHASGTEGIYAYVDKPDFALVVPRTATGFWLVQEHRYPVGQRRWCFPQGSWPIGTSGDLHDLARTELEEETGLIAGYIHRLGCLDVAHGMTNQGVHVFLAEALREGAPRREDTESDMVHQHVSDRELGAMITTGRMVDSSSLAAYTLYLHRRAQCGMTESNGR